MYIYTCFFDKQNFYKQRQAEAKARQHPEAELPLFENYSPPLSTLLFKNIRKYSKKMYRKQVRLF